PTVVAEPAQGLVSGPCAQRVPIHGFVGDVQATTRQTCQRRARGVPGESGPGRGVIDQMGSPPQRGGILVDGRIDGPLPRVLPWRLWHDPPHPLTRLCATDRCTATRRDPAMPL